MSSFGAVSDRRVLDSCAKTPGRSRRLAFPPASDPIARLQSHRDDCVALWRGTSAELPRLGADVGWHRRWRNAQATATLIDEVARLVLVYPRGAPERRAWRDALRGRLLDFGEGHFGWPAGYRRLVFGEAFYETAVEFAHLARRFDPELRLEDLGQALRNVWVGNSLQMLTARPVRLTPALFAYSMLYPTTDNVIDDPGVSGAAKQAFNDRLGRRLLGEHAVPRGVAEAKIGTLVGLLEQEFPRHRHCDVWAHVLAIHRAQVASLRQQQNDRLSETELLELTVAKGGASVLADLSVIAGEAPPAAERLAFCYGVFLQMLDDLQDVSADLTAGHETLFTRAARHGALDTLAERLAHFIDVVLDRHVRASSGADADCAALIRRNCQALLVGLIAREPHRFGRRLRRRVQRQWPVSLRAMRRLLHHAHRRLETTGAQLRRDHGVASPLELLLDRHDDADRVPSARPATGPSQPPPPPRARR